eukprot:2655107-Rhodomonas_salina.1
MSGSESGSSNAAGARPKNFYQSGEKLNDKNETEYNVKRVMGPFAMIWCADEKKTRTVMLRQANLLRCSLQGNYLTEHDIRNVFNQTCEQLDADKNGYLGSFRRCSLWKGRVCTDCKVGALTDPRCRSSGPGCCLQVHGGAYERRVNTAELRVFALQS